MSTRIRFVSVVALLALLAAAAAAFFWQSNTSRFRAPSPTENLNIAISGAYVGSGLLHLAAVKDYFAAEGLAVTLQPHSSGRSALDAVIAHGAEMATSGDTPMMFSICQNLPLAIVATIAGAVRSHGIIARRDRGISTSADLNGKTVGVTLGTDAHFLLNVILANAGIAPDLVRTRPTKSDDMAATLAAGQVDAIATWEPWLDAARAAAGANAVTIFPYKGFSFGFHLVGLREFVQSHPATMQKLLRALLRAERFLEQEPQAARAIIREATRSDPVLFERFWSNYDLRFALNQGLLNMLEDQARWAIASGLTNAREVPNFLDAIYLDAMLAVRPESVSIVR